MIARSAVENLAWCSVPLLGLVDSMATGKAICTRTLSPLNRSAALPGGHSLNASDWTAHVTKNYPESARNGIAAFGVFHTKMTQPIAKNDNDTFKSLGALTAAIVARLAQERSE